MMLQQKTPDDFVLATGETHTVREFCEKAFKRVGMNIRYALLLKLMLIQVLWLGGKEKPRARLELTLFLAKLLFELIQSIIVRLRYV